MRIQPRQVEAFRAVMISGSFSAAAQTMHITQPAISRLIRDFEAEAGFPLFERNGNRVFPREEAVLLYREVEHLYVGLDHIGRIANDIRNMTGGVLRVGTVTSLNGLCVANVLLRFAELYPEVTVIFDTENTERVFDLVTMRHYDLGLVVGGREAGELPDEELAEGAAVAVMTPGHPLADRSEVTLADLADVRVVLPGRRSPLRMVLDEHLRVEGINLRRPIEASLANCCELAARGLGVGVVDPLVMSGLDLDLVARPLSPVLPVTYRVLRPPQAPSSRLTDGFVALLKEAVHRSILFSGATASST
ncbi:LysR substrate-binding domain-containing protein [Consotaella salsifontis]|uniref:DNA-binding transcriptional regulator, LysR family n=1 Tax=Consotaella salsifontis TaxID=1365950 RepID=A0A1T4SVG9_9HYPH|nr:LysR substrate-binding domain-containing protein [Consotaella salsifontis]SKA31908.1 DNA-binding transcriptional regulator, LysR family [Consotaella salsifontis]